MDGGGRERETMRKGKRERGKKGKKEGSVQHNVHATLESKCSKHKLNFTKVLTG